MVNSRLEILRGSMVLAVFLASFSVESFAEPPAAPALLYPSTGALMDNGCLRWCDRIEEDFVWSDVPGAAQYEIFVKSTTAQNPAVHEFVRSSSYSASQDAYVGDGTTGSWFWRVRACNDDGEWGPWSEERVFSFEPLGRDCQVPNQRPTVCSPVPSRFLGQAPLDVSFTVEASDLDGVIVAYRWDFDGDGKVDDTVIGNSMVRHVFERAGVFAVTCTVVDNRGGTATAGTTVRVESERAFSRTIPAVAHLVGAGDTAWRSDLDVTNLGNAAATLSLAFRPAGGGNEVRQTLTLNRGESIGWKDVLVTRFQLPPDAGTKGSVQIESPYPFAVSARTYNDTPAGTFGYGIPAIAAEDGLGPGAWGYLPGLLNDPMHRTHLAMVVPESKSPCKAVISLWDRTPTQVGREIELVTEPGHYRQVDYIFAAAGAAELASALAVAEVRTLSCRAWFFATVVDQRTGDPTLIPMIIAK